MSILFENSVVQKISPVLNVLKSQFTEMINLAGKNDVCLNQALILTFLTEDQCLIFPFSWLANFRN